MAQNKKVILNRGKEFPIKNRHHWIFSGAIKSAPKFEDGDILPIYSYDDEFLGNGYFNNKTVITARMINFDHRDPMDALKDSVAKAFDYRLKIFDENTNAYRLINGEGDNIPGLIVDRYNHALVIQIATVGIDRIKDFIVKTLLAVAKEKNVEIDFIYEKSNMGARHKDGLNDFVGTLYGKFQPQIPILENGIKFIVELENSQKTGLFLDQREMRVLVGEMSKGKKVLNCFSYTGGFSLYAMKGGAVSVDSVDIAPDAVELSKRNFEANGFNLENNKFIATDAFVFLRENELNYDFVILDPPAFAKKKLDIERAKRGYADINRNTMRKMPAGSFLLTCSCSYHMTQDIFEKVVMTAARDAHREVRIIQRHRLGMDHPINIFHSEIDYLKGLLLYIA